MRDCPHCRAVVDGLICPKCGYQDPAYAQLSQPARARLVGVHPQCAHVDRGQQCANPGTLTESTRGASEWFCARHFRPFAGRGYDGKPAPSAPSAAPGPAIALGDFAALRALVAHRPDPRAWARRVIERDAAGERLPLVALAAARAALAAPSFANPGSTFAGVTTPPPDTDPEAIAEREAIRQEAIDAARRLAGDA